MKPGTVKCLMAFAITVSTLFSLAPMTAFGMASQFPVVAENCPSPVTVRYGDSLRKIAKRCGVKASELLAANPQIANPDLILVGQQIRMPSLTRTSNREQEDRLNPDFGLYRQLEGEARFVRPVGDQQTVKRVGEARRTDSDNKATASTVDIPITASQTYQVRAGDSLGKIARKKGVSTAQLLFANPDLKNPNRIYPGQVLTIPPADLEVPEDAWKRQRIDQSLAAAQDRYNAAAGERWVQVDLATQTAHAYEGDQLVRSFIVSTGLPKTPTVTGQFKIWTKLRFDDMKGPGYNLKNVPYVMYFYKGYGLHGTYWHSNFGVPMSNGCVNFSEEDAAWLFDFALVGMVVNVQ